MQWGARVCALFCRTLEPLGTSIHSLPSALELKRRGHTPVLALADVYRPKIEPLGIEFHTLRPDIDPKNTKLVEMVYDVKKGTETGLREFLFPVLRETYDDLLEAATKPVRADLLLLGELNYAGPIVAEITGIPWASYVLAPFSFFSAFDPPVLPPYPKLANADKMIGMGRAMRRLARFVTRKWPEPVYDLRRELGLPKGANPIFDAKHSPNLVLALFSRVLGTEQKDWPHNTLIAGFCFYDSDAGNAALPANLERFVAAGEPPVVFTLGSAAVLAAGDFYEHSASAAKKLGDRALFFSSATIRAIVPSRLFLNQFVLQSMLPTPLCFPHASLVVHQGGVGTTAQCLRAGRPMLIMPYSHDQPDNARRMRRMGVARVIQRSSYKPWRVVRRLRAMLAEPEYESQCAQSGRAGCQGRRREDGVRRSRSAPRAQFSIEISARVRFRRIARPV